MNVYTKKQNIWGQKFLIKGGILLFILLFLNIFTNQIKNSFYLASSPVSFIFSESGNNAYLFFDNIFNAGRLRQEKISIKKENENLIQKNADLQNSLKEKYDLNSALQNNQNFNIKLVKVIGLDLDKDLLTINQGEKTGISENMPLISKEKVVFGKVVKVYDNFSEVLLISSANSSVDAKVQSDDPSRKTVYGVVRGMGDSDVYLDLVNFESEIQGGDILVTSGLEGIFPNGLLIGKITSVIKNDLKPFQTAEVSPFFDVQDLENLFIVTNYKK